MPLKTLSLAVVLSAALVLVPSGAHLAELPNKIALSRDEYLTVQQIYRGWASFGVIVYAALALALAFTLRVRRAPRAFRPALTGLLCLVGTQAIFWVFTFPTNQATSNWTVLPGNWTSLRVQWEYSHAASAVLNLAALVALPHAALTAVRIESGRTPRNARPR